MTLVGLALTARPSCDHGNPVVISVGSPANSETSSPNSVPRSFHSPAGYCSISSLVEPCLGSMPQLAGPATHSAMETLECPNGCLWSYERRLLVTRKR